MSFTESYKQLEKLCGEIMNDDRRVSAYIDEMINTPRGSYLVKGWDSDLKQLKHYRCCLLYTSPSPRDMRRSRMPSSA